MSELKTSILNGIPDPLPANAYRRGTGNHAPKRVAVLSAKEQGLALRNALRYFKPVDHPVLAKEFLAELNEYGHIYMYRLKPQEPIEARALSDYPARTQQAAAIMLMIQNNLDPRVAQHPDELVTYGGNGSVFQNWAQYRLTMKYLAEMTDQQTLVLYSGHPLGLFPSHREAPRVVVTNGLVIPNYSKVEDLNRLYALGVSQYGQMTAGSFMYIGPQGIVHGTTLTVMNALRLKGKRRDGESPIFVTSGLGGMSGAQAKAGKIAGAVAVVAEVNEQVIAKRHAQGWVDEVFHDLPTLVARLERARLGKEAVSLAFHGNIVELWEYFAANNVSIDLGSDQTSLHNPWGGGYYPVGFSFAEAQQLLNEEPERFAVAVRESLRRHVAAVNVMTARGMYFFDYGNAFLLESSRAGADVMRGDGTFRYPSYVQDILGPLCFDYGFGPFRWVVCSGSAEDLAETDSIAAEVLAELERSAPQEIRQQLADNRRWVEEAHSNQLVVGSQARILYADAEGRVKLASAFNSAIRQGRVSAPIVLGRDHHDVSGTDSPFRETSNIYDGSAFTADMAVQNFVGDSFRGATWVSLHNGGGVGWGEVINGGFGLVIDGSAEAEDRLRAMLSWDVNNGVARRSWARNSNAQFAIKRAMAQEPRLSVTLPYEVESALLDELVGEQSFGK